MSRCCCCVQCCLTVVWCAQEEWIKHIKRDGEKLPFVTFDFRSHFKRLWMFFVKWDDSQRRNQFSPFEKWDRTTTETGRSKTFSFAIDTKSILGLFLASFACTAVIIHRSRVDRKSIEYANAKIGNVNHKSSHKSTIFFISNCWTRY